MERTHLEIRRREGDLWKAEDELNGKDASFLLLLVLVLHVLGVGRKEAVDAMILDWGLVRIAIEIDKRMRDFFVFQVLSERESC